MLNKALLILISFKMGLVIHPLIVQWTLTDWGEERGKLVPCFPWSVVPWKISTAVCELIQWP